MQISFAYLEPLVFLCSAWRSTSSRRLLFGGTMTVSIDRKTERMYVNSDLWGTMQRWFGTMCVIAA